MVTPRLLVGESIGRRAHLNTELVREDIDELGTVAVLATDDLLFLLVVIA